MTFNFLRGPYFAKRRRLAHFEQQKDLRAENLVIFLTRAAF
jgi:hypothetical protein